MNILTSPLPAASSSFDREAECDEGRKLDTDNRDTSSVDGSTWQAYLNIRIDKKTHATRIAHCRHQGPLYIQRPFYPEGKFLPHIYLLHPPGGVVSGDELRINIDIEKNAAALFTTPGAGRVYRARADKKVQKQVVTLDVAENASIEWFPLENILYPNSNASLITKVLLKPGSRFVGWDVNSLGLPAQKLAFDDGQLSQRFEIWVEGVPKLIEHLRVNSVNELNTLSAGLRDCPINGMFIAGPFEEASLGDIVQELRDAGSQSRVQDNSSRLGISAVNGFVIARYLGQCSESAKCIFEELWRGVRPLLLERAVCSPRIWST